MKLLHIDPVNAVIGDHLWTDILCRILSM